MTNYVKINMELDVNLDKLYKYIGEQPPTSKIIDGISEDMQNVMFDDELEYINISYEEVQE